MICGRSVPHFLTEAESLESIFQLEFFWTAAYLALWLGLGVVAHVFLVGRMPASKHPIEDKALCMAQHLTGIVKCCVLIPASNIAIYILFTSPPRSVAPGSLAYQLTEIAGVLFD